MFNTDIVRLYKKGLKLNMSDNDTIYYNHYILGKTICTFSYVKELYALLKWQ